MHKQKELAAMRPLTMHQSDEVYILKKYSWLVLSNQDNIDYSQEMKIDSHFRYFMTLYDKEEKLFDLVPELREMRDQKELYIRFNKAHFEDISEVEGTGSFLQRGSLLQSPLPKSKLEDMKNHILQIVI